MVKKFRGSMYKRLFDIELITLLDFLRMLWNGEIFYRNGRCRF